MPIRPWLLGRVVRRALGRLGSSDAFSALENLPQDLGAFRTF
jgi:hypothetical protein